MRTKYSRRGNAGGGLYSQSESSPTDGRIGPSKALTLRRIGPSKTFALKNNGPSTTLTLRRINPAKTLILRRINPAKSPYLEDRLFLCTVIESGYFHVLNYL